MAINSYSYKMVVLISTALTLVLSACGTIPTPPEFCNDTYLCLGQPRPLTAPGSEAASLSLSEDGEVSGKLVGISNQELALKFVVVDPPQHGSLDKFDESTGEFTYKPEVNHNGLDSFSYKVIEGELESEIQVVSLDVSAILDAPMAIAGSINVLQANAYSGVLGGQSGEGGALKYKPFQNQSGAPQHGSVAIDEITGAFTYTPNDAGYLGQDQFMFKVVENGISSLYAKITVNVTTPVAISATISMAMDTAYSGNLMANSILGNPLSFKPWMNASGAPQHGTVVIDEATGAFSYTPDAGYVGPDQFFFKAVESNISSPYAKISVNVN